MAVLQVVICLYMALGGILGNDIVVEVEHGKLSGSKEKTITGVNYYSFKGIPYAKPPVGELRFRAPQPLESWDGTKDATKHGSKCPQVLLLTNQYQRNNEDCLYLNVYSRNIKPKSPLPVIFVIHGGANKFGSGDTDTYGPDFLVKDAVVVTFNFRLDTLGSLSLGTCDVPGNAGLKDQVAALKWVQKNIHNFGGDPNCVTLIGDTSGGASVTYHLISPMSKGLFHRAIATSGSLFCDSLLSYQPERRALVQAQSLGYNGTSDAELLNFYQTVNYDKLINTTVSTAAILASETETLVPFKMLPFTGAVIEKECPEGNFLTENPLDILNSGNVNNVDVMFGYSQKEALVLIQLYETKLLQQYKRYPELFVPSKILINSTDTTKLEVADKIIEYYFGDKEISVKNIKEFINYASSASIVYDVQRFYRQWPAVGNKFVFKFSSYSDRNYYGRQAMKYGLKGTSHFDIDCYLYDPKSLKLPFNLNSVAYKIIKLLTQGVIKFAKTGKPTADESQWPQYTSSCRASVNIKEDMTVEYDVDGDDYSFWQDIYYKYMGIEI